jgi:hypothetical protein
LERDYKIREESNRASREAAQAQLDEARRKLIEATNGKGFNAKMRELKAEQCPLLAEQARRAAADYAATRSPASRQWADAARREHSMNCSGM